MEKMKEYHGLYHVLGGTISIMDGKTMDDLNIMSLFDRITPDTKEVIIATNATREGETTALFLAKLKKVLIQRVLRMVYQLEVLLTMQMNSHY